MSPKFKIIISNVFHNQTITHLTLLAFKMCILNSRTIEISFITPPAFYWNFISDSGIRRFNGGGTGGGGGSIMGSVRDLARWSQSMCGFTHVLRVSSDLIWSADVTIRLMWLQLGSRISRFSAL
jgi:hypothetical protein